MATTNAVHNKDPYNLSRFENAQNKVYAQTLFELHSGQKQTHWMWFIFPQIDGLGRSQYSTFYAIKSKQEASAYLIHSIVGARLVECVETILSVHGRSASQIFGSPDDKKLNSSMTLFAHVSPDNSLYQQVLRKYFDGRHDDRTLKLLDLI